ncbi:MAG TPA: DUF4389 domain-containing protein [Ghiorsea sp.]|nr:DUF4389 domain-containing protein [Ghiorsea sp.]HIP07960.1 DUF4389 domain-containing protein [Mariprofundaceae bacterium]
MRDEKNVEECLKNKSVWIRLLYMILFTILYSIAEIVIFAVAVYQFLSVLFTGNKDEKILNLGKSLSAYVYQVLQFLTFNSETKPYPMGDWPDAKLLAAHADKPKRAPRKTTTRKPAAKKPTAKRKPAAKKEEPKAEDKPEDKPAEG